MLRTIACLVMAMVITVFSSTSGFCQSLTANDGPLTAQEQQLAAWEILAEVNKARAADHKTPLVLDRELMEAAVTRVQELPVRYDHTRPDGSACFTVLRYHNAYKGENIAAGYADSQAVMEGWLASPGHRSNILNEHFTKMGIAYCYAPDTPYKHYWVQMFLSEDV